MDRKAKSKCEIGRQRGEGKNEGNVQKRED